MGLFGDFKQAISESPGRVLWSQLQDTQQKMARLPERICAAALLGFIQKREKLIPSLDNMSSDGRIAMGKTLQKLARDTFDANLSEGYALWLAGAWLESIDRPGIEAAKVHVFLDEIALENGGSQF